jgi:hypothetical protein
MPAVWGFDVLFALLLTALVAIPASVPKRAAWAGVGLGLVALLVANVGRQEKAAARSRMLWAALHHVEATAPQGARIAWVGDKSLGTEEGIHFAWHLLHRGRGDVRVGLFDGPTEGASGVWGPGPTFAANYRLGRKRFTCRLDARRDLPSGSGWAMSTDP